MSAGDMTEAEKGALRAATGMHPRYGTFTQMLKRVPSVLGLAGAGGLAAYGALSGGEARAGGLPVSGPGRDESLTQYRLRGLGLPSTPGEAANAASYAVPGLGEGRLAADIGTAGGEIARSLRQPEPVMGKLGDPRVAAFQNWVANQRGAQQPAYANLLHAPLGVPMPPPQPRY